jgi:membrane protease subunit HflK
MAWNEPGGKRRDPWQGGGGGGGGGAPDLDAMLKRLRDGFGRVFGGGGAGGAGVWILIVGVIGAWFLLDSWRTIDETQRGVVLRFGQFDRIMQPGLNLKWPSPIEQVLVVDATRVRSTSDQVRILTRDENIISVEFSVQYTVGDPRAFLFAVRDPDETIRAAAESAVRQVIGSRTMEQSFGQLAELSAEARTALQQLLDTYSRKVLGGEEGVASSFFTVGEFNFQNVRPPPEVQDAFDDAISAREDKQRLENEAKAYASKIVPEARGQAARVRAEAEGARDAQIAVAEGEAERFTLLAAQYRLAPEVTRKRLMLETMQEVLAGSPKVIVEGGGQNVLYLPLDRLGQPGAAGLPVPQAGMASPSAGASRPAAATPAIDPARTRDSIRTPREGRN